MPWRGQFYRPAASPENAALPAAADDPRDLVRKGVSWALRTTGRRSPKLHRAALAVATRLAASSDAGARWVGRDVARDLQGPIATRVVQERAVKKR